MTLRLRAPVRCERGRSGDHERSAVRRSRRSVRVDIAPTRATVAASNLVEAIDDGELVARQAAERHRGLVECGDAARTGHAGAVRPC